METGISCKKDSTREAQKTSLKWKSKLINER